MTSYTEKQMKTDFEEAMLIIAGAGFTYQQNNHYVLTLFPDSKNLGVCHKFGSNYYEIRLNQKYASVSCHDSIINTLIHEILHSFPDGMKHTGAWKDYTAIIYEKTGRKILRKGTKEECKEYNREKIGEVIKKNPNKVVYEIYCDNCNRRLETVQKKTQAVKHLLEYGKDNVRFYCPKCNSHNLSIKVVPYVSYVQKYLENI